MTYRELDNYLTGYGRMRQDEWRRTRFAAYITYCANAKSPVPITQFLPIGEDEAQARPTRRLMNKREYKIMQQNWN